MAKKKKTGGRPPSRKPPIRTGAKRLEGNPFFLMLPTVRREVDSRLSGFLDSKLEHGSEHGVEVHELIKAVQTLSLRGGKRLRPALVVTGYRAAADGDLDSAFDIGVSLELLQTYFLIHDDWMDQDDVRRGGPSVHALLRRRFRSVHKGHSAAILAGDLAATLALKCLVELELPPRRAKAMLSTFADMQQDAIYGQQLDLLGKKQQAERVYALKTASYTVRGPLRLGAQLAGATQALLSALDRFALPAGIAFQLQDDLLGTFGEPKTTGKPRGNDLKAGKRTALLELGMTCARGAQLTALKSVVGNRRATARQVERAIGVLEACGAKDQVRARIEELSQDAEQLANSPRIAPAGRQLLLGALSALTNRVS